MREKPARALGLAATEHYVSSLATLMDSSVLSKGLGNPIDSGAFGLIPALDEPLPIKMLFGLLD